MNEASEIFELLRRLRDLVNQSETRDLLMKDMASWSQLASSLDVIGDAEQAIVAYSVTANEEAERAPADNGPSYLLTYGVLQAMYLQQDALEHLSEALGGHFSPHENPQLKRIRDIRNNSVGHTTKRGRGDDALHYGIVQASLSNKGFQLLLFDSSRVEWIDTADLLRDQAEAAIGALKSEVARLEESPSR